MARLLQQTWAQVRKNLLINVRRHAFTTMVRAFWLPVIFASFIAFARNLFVEPARYGIGKPAPLTDLSSAMDMKPGEPLIFIHNGLGSDVDTVIADMQDELRGGERVTRVLERDVELRKACKQSLQGVSGCFAAVVFENATRWKYTIRADSAMGLGRFDAEKHDTDVQEYLLPLQRSVDRAIARVASNGSSVPEIEVQEYIYTSKSEEEYQDWLRQRFSSAIINYISVVLLIGMIGIVYHLTGFQAKEREAGLATLIESMGGSKLSRVLSYLISFPMMYVAGWVIIAGILWGGMFRQSSLGIIIVWHVLTGFSFAGWSLFAGSIFKKAQLSGISVTIVSLGLGIVAQVSKDSGTGAYAVLSLLFPPMNYVFHSITLGRHEAKQVGANVVKAPPEGNSQLPVIAFWVFLIVQIVAFPMLAMLVERYLYGTDSPGHRHINSSAMDVGNAVELRGFTKRYPPRLLTKLFGSRKDAVVAVDNLDLNARRGEILVLLGANGSGKTTTLEAIAGLAGVREGTISITTGGQTVGGIGICPQKNVLWDELTVMEHVTIWNLIKSPNAGDGKDVLKQLIADCDLAHKRHAKSKTLSGGQKRKLQLAAMFTGNSTVCAIDEVSSGLDPLSRRKIWDIVLAARGERTILMTSHYLDEADLLADHIAILSKGRLKCEGSAVALKTQLGGGYRVHAPLDAPVFDGVPMKRFYDQTVYNVPDSAAANALIEGLEKAEVADYYVAGPTIEDVFLKVAEESVATRAENAGEKGAGATHLGAPGAAQDEISAVNSAASDIEEKDGGKGLQIEDGHHISLFAMTWVMIRKRITILQRGYLPTIAAIIIPILAAGITMVVMKDFEGVSCSAARQISVSDVTNFTFTPDFDVVLGPRDRVQQRLAGLADVLVPNSGSGGNAGAALMDGVRLNWVDTAAEFNSYIKDNYHNVTPGGLFIESDTAGLIAFQADKQRLVRAALTMHNFVNNLLYSVPGSITTQYLTFDFIWPQGQGTTLLFITYTGLAFAAFPAFFALYPTQERLRKVRALHYSNGVRSLPLWLAYTLFDFAPVLLISVVCIIILSAAAPGMYGLGYLFVVFVLFGLCSIQLAYNISLVCKSQLSAFAFAAGGQASAYLIYFIIYLSIITFAPPDNLDASLSIMHYVVSAVTPMGSLIRALFVALNSFSIDCDDETLKPYPGAMGLYGAPILYLVVQSALLFLNLLRHDSGRFQLPRVSVMSLFHRKPTPSDTETGRGTTDAADIAAEAARTQSSTDPLRVLALQKRFGTSTAVDNVTFGVPANEIFALLGPNGAGKTTTLNLIRGLTPPTSGRVLVADTPVYGPHRAAARAHLGVCPQFDAADRMSVSEHLLFYARIRGVQNPPASIAPLLRAVGLEGLAHRAASQLSGGNKRKLSLAIALTGNPSVLLLDEPSSGMDAAAKRVMWRTLAAVAPGRSVVLTTHSMEECAALATRAGILATRMLALGTTAALRARHGDSYLVHLVLAPSADLASVADWVREAFPGATLEARAWGGQLRFSIAAGGAAGGVAGVFRRLEGQARGRGVVYWSVDRGTMDMVFLEVVGRAGVGEEGGGNAGKRGEGGDGDGGGGFVCEYGLFAMALMAAGRGG
ncbi:hypothetical protein EDC01DRAFT_716765 [Geopyxis carbonaria]|nr:hypothetical protein EDC01DRAFT_716765 [Geopyxis carbonaria]